MDTKKIISFIVLVGSVSLFTWILFGGSSESSNSAYILILYSKKELETGNRTILFDASLAVGEDISIFSGARIGSTNVTSGFIENVSSETLRKAYSLVLFRGPKANGRDNRVLVFSNGTIVLEANSYESLKMVVDRFTLALAKPYILGLSQSNGVKYLIILKPGSTEKIGLRWLSQREIQDVLYNIPLIDQNGGIVDEFTLSYTLLGPYYIKPN